MGEGEILDLGKVLRAEGLNHRGYVVVKGGAEFFHLPIVAITGDRPGPAAWIAAGGGDALAAAALAMILPALEPAMVTGRLIVTPALGDPPARRRRGGGPHGDSGSGRWGVQAPPPFEAIADEIMDSCDAMVELSGAGRTLLRAPFVAYSTAGSRSESSATLARAAGFPLIWRARGDDPVGSLTAEASRRGKEGVLIGLGGAGRVEEAWAANLALALQGVLAGAGVLRASPRPLPSYQVFHEVHGITVGNGGVWRRAVEPEVPVARGTILGRIHDPLGRIAEVVKAPTEGVVLGIHPGGIVEAGLTVAELAPTSGERGGPGIP